MSDLDAVLERLVTDSVFEGVAGLGGADTAPAEIIVLDQQDPTIGDPNQASAPSLAIHDVEEGPEESVGLHEVDPSATVSGLVNPGDRVGFNPAGSAGTVRLTSSPTHT
jgi:hypothetical protein